jgi:hypothetical protein
MTPRAELYICLSSINVNYRRVPTPRPSIGVLSLAPALSTPLRDRMLGKSPLRLIVSRRWHDQDSFTDTLDCGHESSLQFTSFGYIEDQYLHRIPPTAKRRRCQQCKSLGLISPAVTVTADSVGKPVELRSSRSLINPKPRVDRGAAVEAQLTTGTQGNPRSSWTPSSPSTAAKFNLYESCKEAIRSVPCKPVKSEKTDKRRRA